MLPNFLNCEDPFSNAQNFTDPSMLLTIVLGGFKTFAVFRMQSVFFWEFSRRLKLSWSPRTMEPILSSETSAFKLQTPGKFPKEHRLQINTSSNVESNLENVNLRVEVRKYLPYFCFIFRMTILHLAIVNVIISLSAVLNVTSFNYLGYSIERYD